jgi:putrescine aminotransferase
LVTTYTLEEIENLSIHDVRSLYVSYVNQGQVSLLSSFSPARLIVEKALGQYIHLKDGTKVSDFTAGIGVLNLGHNHPKILEARIDYQNKKKMEVHKSFLSPYLAALSHSVASILPKELCKSYFCNSGSEAVEGAVKLAYKSFNGKRDRIATANISFHGKLLGSGGLTGSKEVLFKWPTIPNIDRFIYNDISSITELVERYIVDGKSKHYAILVEPFNASNVQECDGHYLRQLRSLCTLHEIPLIFDEVYTGWAKTGKWFYFQHYDIVPDLLSMSKSFGGGKASISGYISTNKIFDAAYGKNIDATAHSTTYNGFGEECITAIAAIKTIKEENLNQVAQHVEEFLLPKLLKLKAKYPDWVLDARGKGALLGLFFNSDINPIIDRLIDFIPFGVLQDPSFRKKLVVSAIIHELLENFKILTYFGSNQEVPLIIAPTLMATTSDLEYFMNAIDSVLKKGKFELILNFVKFKYGKKYL